MSGGRVIDSSFCVLCWKLKAGSRAGMPTHDKELDAVRSNRSLTAAPCLQSEDTPNGHTGILLQPPFKICKDDVLGRHLVATRDLLPGEVILEEAPLVTGPPLDFRPCCVSCYKYLDQENHTTCGEGCGWPVCSEKCAKSPTHRPECEVTRNSRRKKVSIEDWNKPCPLFECLIVLRCLTLRDSNPSLWVKLSRLEAHIAKRQGTAKWERERVSIACFLKEFFQLEYPEQEIHRICGVIQINGYGVHLTNPSYIALYDELSFIEHHCIPNCSKVWNASGTLTVHTASFVPRGHHLSICYTNPLWGTVLRRDHLAQELLFCRCSRCTDPSECGTYFSALCCKQHSCDGYLLPKESVTEMSSNFVSRGANITRWKCTKCEAMHSETEVDVLLEDFKQKLVHLNRGDVNACKKFLEDGSKHLHTNHFYLTEVKIHLAELIGRRPSSMDQVSDDLLELKVSLCGQVLALADVLFPAVRRVTGLIRFELYKAMTEASIRKHVWSIGVLIPASGKHQGVTNGDLISLSENCEDILNEAISILRCEPDIVPELFTEDSVRTKIDGC